MPSAEAKIKIKAEDKTQKDLSTAQTRVSKLTGAVKAYGLQLAAVFLAARKVYKIGKDLTAAFMKQEEAVAALDSALRSTGIYTHAVSGEMQELAKQLQATTKYGDEATLSAMGFLQSLAGLSSEGLQKLTPLLQDFATGMRLDLSTAASLVGKTLGSTTNALTRYGIVIDMTGTKEEKLAELQEQINSKFSDMARIMGSTFAGKVTRLNNLFGDMKEILGGLLAEAVEPLIDSLIKFSELGTGLEKIVRIIRGIAAWTVTWVGFWLNVYGAVIKSVVALADTFKNLGKVIGIVFNPKKWGKGEMKAALDDIKNKVVDTAINIGETWDKWVVKVQTSWAKALADDVMPVIQTFEDESGGMVEVIEEGSAAIEEQVEHIIEWRDQMAMAGLDASFYTSQLRNMSNETDRVVESTQELKDLVVVWSDQMAMAGLDASFYTNAMNEMADKTDTVVIPALKDELDILRELNGAWIDYKSSAEVALEAAAAAAEKQQQLFQDISDIASLAYDTIGKGVSQYYQNQSIEAKNWYKKQKGIIENSVMDEEAKAEAIAALDEQMAEKESAIRTKEAQAQKKMAIFGILVNTARGIAEAFPAFWKMAAIGVAGAVQLAIAKSVAIPTYQEGGIVPGYGGGDIVPAMLEPGEMVIRKEIVREAQQGGGEIVIHNYISIDGDRLGNWITRGTRSKQIPIYSGALVNV